MEIGSSDPGFCCIHMFDINWYLVAFSCSLRLFSLNDSCCEKELSRSLSILTQFVAKTLSAISCNVAGHPPLLVVRL